VLRHQLNVLRHGARWLLVRLALGRVEMVSLAFLMISAVLLGVVIGFALS
jgi:hypothetical protein